MWPPRLAPLGWISVADSGYRQRLLACRSGGGGRYGSTRTGVGASAVGSQSRPRHTCADRAPAPPPPPPPPLAAAAAAAAAAMVDDVSPPHAAEAVTGQRPGRRQSGRGG